MDKARALQKLYEAGDLVGMIEDLLSSAQNGRIQAATISGMRITLRSVREYIENAHDTLAPGISTNDMAASESRPSAFNRAGSPITNQEAKIESAENANGTGLLDSQRMLMRRKDLRASIDKIVDPSS